MRVLPENILRCLSPADRKSLGKAGMTAEEALQRAAIRNERHLQTLIVNLLRLRGIEPLWHRTDRTSAATIGWPDITFAVMRPPNIGWANTLSACLWEVKLPGQPLSPEQEKMIGVLRTPPNAWRISIIHSVDEALEDLRILGL
jgi:hypothetical protein